MIAFARASLSHQFLMISFPVLLAGMLTIGLLVGQQVEESVVHRMGGVTGMYVDSMISPHVQSLNSDNVLDEKDRTALKALLTQTPLGQRIVSFKIWRPDGTVLYSADAELIGRAFPVGEGLAEALAGDVHSEISTLTADENITERSRWDRLVETYTPIHALGQGNIIAAAEFYQPVEDVLQEAFLAQRKSWLVVACVTVSMYLMLFTLVRRGSQTIEQQRGDLNQKVVQLIRMNSQNEKLHERIRRAAASNTTANESLLRRISADLHDGPGQDLSFALMRFDAIGRAFGKCNCKGLGHEAMPAELKLINAAIASALKDMRTICAGLRLPALDLMGIRQIAVRAIEDFESKTGATVKLAVHGSDRPIPLPLRIAFYRLMQEALANGFRHAGGQEQTIDVSLDDSCMRVQISDKGPGFDSAASAQQQGQGLKNMRDRAEVLGGSFAVISARGQGTTIEVTMPLTVPEVDYG